MGKEIVEFCKTRLPLISYPVINALENVRFLKAKASYDAAAITKYKGCARKERCFIVATGPSLTLSDVELLKDEDTFAINSCYKMFDKTDWRPLYYCITDGAVWNKIHDDIEHSDIKTLFYSQRVIGTQHPGWVPLLSKVAYPLYPNAHLSMSTELFSMDATKCVYVTRTVVYPVIQLAVTMGYKKIYLLGTDCNYTGKQNYSELTNYGMPSPKDAGESMFKGYSYTEEFSKQHGFKVYNATRGGNLEVFERVSLESVLSE